MNAVIRLLEERYSVRAFEPQPPTEEERAAILHAAMRAPTAGNLMLYTVIEVTDQAAKDALAVFCDNQPFIAKAPWVLVFVADMRKWTELFEAGGVEAMAGVEHRSALGLGDLLLSCSDALIAAQTAVIAAESLGIGSCYIGDILENGEEVAALLGLPPQTLPIAMLCLGRPRGTRRHVPRYEKNVVRENRYQRLTEEDAAETLVDLQRVHAREGLPAGVANVAQDVYRRKFTSTFMREMNRSAAWWVDRWCGKAEDRP